MFQKQKEMMESGQQIQRPQSLISQEGLQKMGKDLVRLCDGVERHGLVDYQYGVWEEQIIDSRFLCHGCSHTACGILLLTNAATVLEECLDLYEASNAPGSGNDESSSSHRR